MGEPFLRAIRTEDDAAIASIIRTVMPTFGADGPGFAIHDPEVSSMTSAYDRPGAAYFVIVAPSASPVATEHDERVVGGGGVAPLDGGDADTCEIRKMYFLPEARGLGMGKKLLAHCLETARALGYRRAYLETLTGMDAAQALYAKMGFTRIDGPRGCTGHGGCDRFYERAL